MKRELAVLAVLGVFAFSGSVHAEGDAERGEGVFAQCIACHSVEPGRNGVGPSLHAIMGNPAAGVADYSYSDALESADLTWDDDTMTEFLRDPENTVPGTNMAFPGLQDDEEIADVVAYLHRFSGE